MIRLLRIALMFYTRIPAGKNLPGDEQDLNRATGFLPGIGLIVGGLSAGAFVVSSLLLPHGPSVVIALIAGVLATGAFHEDGFADTCDGLGGGWSVSDRLRIMKDSRVGSYALTGLILLFLLKYALLSSLAPMLLPFSLMSSHIAARLLPLMLIRQLPYVRVDELSKAKPVSKGISPLILMAGCFSAAVMVAGLYLVFRPGNPWLILIPALPLAVSPIIAAYYRRMLGGYTGDLLGAAEQLGEVAILAAIAAMAAL
ncbi:adenosylcobinamide-GDP ribazoletransferase [Salinispira pacifica]|uniref:Adenosylcobinamide-GDP ribazoletransferase n=1 Tax=Salinispira pacifica TaxID=1307761 RepID=V5WI02_9SPIO|nr:adenosylcobinamide-GDP ribazoletransferase [Salinispira pacifica]AHC15423.1 Cobalamin synthase [Salinispira pacifica]